YGPPVVHLLLAAEADAEVAGVALHAAPAAVSKGADHHAVSKERERVGELIVAAALNRAAPALQALVGVPGEERAVRIVGLGGLIGERVGAAATDVAAGPAVDGRGGRSLRVDGTRGHVGGKRGTGEAGQTQHCESDLLHIFSFPKGSNKGT